MDSDYEIKARMDAYNRAKMPHSKVDRVAADQRKRAIKQEMKAASERALEAARDGPISGGVMSTELNYLLADKLTRE